MLNVEKVVLLPRARLDLSDDSFSFLKIDQKQKHYFQALLDKSSLDARLSVFYSKQNLTLLALTTTRIIATDEIERLYQSYQATSYQSYDIIIFVSKNAGALAKFILPDAFLKQAKLFSIGKSCQEFFTQQGLEIINAQQESAQGLLSLSELSSIQGKKVLICKGEKGLSDLQEQCKLRGAKVEVLDLYQRQGVSKLTLPALENIAEIYGVSVFALKHLLEGVSVSKADSLTLIPVLAMSERIASEASLLGFSTIKVQKI